MVVGLGSHVWGYGLMVSGKKDCGVDVLGSYIRRLNFKDNRGKEREGKERKERKGK